MQCALDGFLQLTLSVHQGAEDLGEQVMETHGNFAGGDGHLPEALGQMRAVAFEDSRAEGSQISPSAMLALEVSKACRLV